MENVSDDGIQEVVNRLLEDEIFRNIFFEATKKERAKILSDSGFDLTQDDIDYFVKLKRSDVEFTVVRDPSGAVKSASYPKIIV